MSSTFTSTIATIGIDLGKNTFHLVGLDRRGAIVLQLKLSRGQLERRLANVPRCLIGMEACSGSHHIGRRLTELGHDVRLIPALGENPLIGSSRPTVSERSYSCLGSALRVVCCTA